MAGSISKVTRLELIRAVAQRYRTATRTEKGRILDEFVKLTNCHRKHAVRLLGGEGTPVPITPHTSRRIYDEAVREALVVIWEAADRICGKRLKVALPDFMDSLEHHGHLKLDTELRNKLLTVSAATIDRILSPVRREAGARAKRRRTCTSGVKGCVPVRTFADWHEPVPGYFEVDFVAHNGGSSTGSCVHSLVLTDIASGWTDCVALVVHEQTLLVEALGTVSTTLPIPLRGIDSDNDSVFMNDTVVEHCRTHQIEFTRSRAYQKNDQAWIEQKNGAVVRRFVGHHRLSGILATQVLGRLYQVVRLYVNFFQPSFKLRAKARDGSKVHKSYHRPATPCERLLNSNHVGEEEKKRLREQKADLDPIQLLHTIRELQAALAALGDSSTAGTGPTPLSKDLSEFLTELPKLWKTGEVRPTHRTRAASPRAWRTRKDPFESVWPELLNWLECDPDSTATELFSKLRERHPGVYVEGQLRTLQRRVHGWRRMMARNLIGISRNS